MKSTRRKFIGGMAASGVTWLAKPAAGGATSAWVATAGARPRVEFDANTGAPVRFAASELEKYLAGILGREVPGKGKEQPRIVLRVVKDPGLGDEGFEILIADRTLTISGAPLGVVFGVFEFLRRFGGCQFSGLGPDCEEVPRRKRIEVNASLRMVPKLSYRGYQFYYPEPLELTIQRLDWMVKNGVNYVMFSPFPDDAAEPGKAVDPNTGEPAGGRDFRFAESWWKSKVEPEIFKRGLKLDFNHHNLHYWIPPQRYFAQHPEWYPLIDGQRTMEINKQLAMCTTNEEAVRTLISNVKVYLRANPLVKVVGMIVEDGWGMCQCQNCVREDLDPQDIHRSGLNYKSPEGENRSKTLRYARLANRVAREIRVEFPDVLVGHSAYLDIQWPPRGLQLEPNVITWVAVYYRDGANPLSDNSPLAVNRFFFDVLKQWKATQKSRVTLYEYYMGTDAQRSLPWPISEVICRDWPHLKKLGIEGATIQSWSTNHNTYGLNNLAFARNAWEDRVNHEALLDGYLLGMFGSAAVEIKPVFVRMIRALQKVETEGPQVSHWLSQYDPKTTLGGSFLPDGYNIVYMLEELGPDFLDEAVKRARGKAASEREKRQVELFATVVTFWKKAEASLRLVLLAGEAEKKGQRAEAVAMLTEAAEKSEAVLAHMKTMPARGWVSVTSALRWRQFLEGYRKRAEELRRS